MSPEMRRGTSAALRRYYDGGAAFLPRPFEKLPFNLSHSFIWAAQLPGAVDVVAARLTQVLRGGAEFSEELRARGRVGPAEFREQGSDQRRGERGTAHRRVLVRRGRRG